MTVNSQKPFCEVIHYQVRFQTAERVVAETEEELGIGGKGVIPNRERDRYGFGFYYIDVSNPELQGLFQSIKLLRDEYGFEAFYNIAITPWLRLTPDIQIIRGAQREKVSIAAVPPFIRRKDIETSTVLGLRLKVVF